MSCKSSTSKASRPTNLVPSYVSPHPPFELHAKYLLLSYPISQPKDAHVGAVKPFSPPQPPQPPTLPADLAGELAAYDAVEPTKADESVARGSAVEDAGQGAEAFLSFLEADVKPAEAHH